MRGVNTVFLIGNVGADPEFKYLDAGTAVANFGLATSEKWKDKSGELQERTEWHRVSVFGKNAENVNQYVKKGAKVCVEGALRYRSVDNEDGTKRYYTDIIARNVTFLDSSNGGDPQSEGEQEAGKSDLPF